MLEWNAIWGNGFAADDVVGAALLVILLSAFVVQLVVDAERFARAAPPRGATRVPWFRRVGLWTAGLRRRIGIGTRAWTRVGPALPAHAPAVGAFPATARAGDAARPDDVLAAGETGGAFSEEPSVVPGQDARKPSASAAGDAPGRLTRAADGSSARHSRSITASPFRAR